jgi:hypothetical protein
MHTIGRQVTDRAHGLFSEGKLLPIAFLVLLRGRRRLLSATALLPATFLAATAVILLRCALGALSGLASGLILFLIASLLLTTLATCLGPGRRAGTLWISTLFVSIFRHRFNPPLFVLKNE